LTLPKSRWPKLAALLETRLAGQFSLFEDEAELPKAANQAMEHYDFLQTKQKDKIRRQDQRELVNIDMNGIEIALSRSLGPELVAHTMWEHLDLDSILQACGFTLTEQALAKAVLIARLIEASSDLAAWEWLRNRTALLELLPVNLSDIGKDAVYEIADKLWIHKSSLEKTLRSREQGLFVSEPTLFLYDLTNTCFEGRCINNELAKRAKSKEKRNDCPLVTLALVVDERGFPLFSQIYEGNQSEPETLSAILNRLYEPDLFQHLKPTIVMDRGIATKDNLALLKEKKYPFIVIERRAVAERRIKPHYRS